MTRGQMSYAGRIRCSSSRLLVLCFGFAPSVLHGQQLNQVEYAAKFACGLRGAAETSAQVWDAVSPGRYFTAINIRNGNRDTAVVAMRVATTRSAPVPGTLIPLIVTPSLPSEPVKIPPQLALEIDCREILAAAQQEVSQKSPFLKGFLVLATNSDLDVVAVYSAGSGAGVQTMDVERVPARRRAASCPDLAISNIRTPEITSNLHTRIRVSVRNLGSVGASNVEVYVEDESRPTTDVDRIQNGTIAFIAAGSEGSITFEFPYQLPPISWPTVIVKVDPKNAIAECDEANNARRLTTS